MTSAADFFSLLAANRAPAMDLSDMECNPCPRPLPEPASFEAHVRKLEASGLFILPPVVLPGGCDRRMTPKDALSLPAGGTLKAETGTPSQR